MGPLLKKPKLILKSLLDVLLPPACYICGVSCSSKYGLCEDCLRKIFPIAGPHCPKCGRRIRKDEAICVECTNKISHVDKSWSCCYYKEAIKNCVHLFKYNGYMGLIDIFSNIMSDFARKNKISEEIDVIVPVPIFSAKKRERKYNHAEILARSLSRELSIPIDLKNLRKIKWTRSQSEFDRKRRLENVVDTFMAIDKTAFSGKRVLIVDDVYTTGATVNECAKVLIDAGASKASSLTLARGV